MASTEQMYRIPGKKRYSGRSLAAGLAAALFLGACGGPGSEVGPGAATPETEHAVSSQPQGHATGIADFLVDHRNAPLCVTPEHLSFSWKLEGEERGVSQSACQIVVRNETDGQILWDSGRVSSDKSVGIPYGGEKLRPRGRYCASLTLWDQTGTRIGPAETTFEMAGEDTLFEEASWIAPPQKAYPDIRTDTVFTLEADLRMPTDSAGLVWGYSDEDHRLYREQIRLDREEDTARLVLELIEKDDIVWSEKSSDLSCPASVLAAATPCYPHAPGTETEKGFHLEIRVDGNRLINVIDGETVWETELPEERGARCAIGVHHDRGNAALIDNLCLSDAAGQILFEDFSDPAETIFGAQAAEITGDGWLKANGCLLVTPGGNTRSDPAPMFRRGFQTFTEHGDIQRARLYASAAGIYEAYLNGSRVDSGWFSPGNRSYTVRFPYQTLDVTDRIVSGGNALGFVLGHGWFDRAAGYTGTGGIWGDHNAMIARLDILYEDGTLQSIVTDDSWDVYTDGPVRTDDLWQGETYDARKEPEGWSEASFEPDPAWTQADIRPPFSHDPLMTPQEEMPVSALGFLAPEAEMRPTEGVTVYDFGKEITGVCRIAVSGRSGAEVTVRYGEWLNEEILDGADDIPGTIYTANLAGAQSMDRYILAGDAETEIFMPTFTFHGFRYLQLETDGEVRVEKVESVVLSSVPCVTGEFLCSDELLNRFWENSIRSLQGCYLSVPMDCPQRSERFGWAGDAQIYSRTALYQGDLYLFYRKYLQDLRDAQDESSGCIGDIAPWNYARETRGCGGNGGHNGWADAAVLIPWNLYLQSGSLEILAESYDGIRGWIGYLEENADEWIMPDEGYGDHLGQTDIPAQCVHTAWAAHSCDIASRIAEILGKQEDADRFREDFRHFQEAWFAGWSDESGLTANGAQTGYAMGIVFGLYPDKVLPAAGERLTESVFYNGNRMSCGFAGASFLCEALERVGHPDLCYEILTNRQPGTIGYQIDRGATTCWEYPADGTADENGEYSLDGSLNHAAVGAPAVWLCSGCLGIRPDEKDPGWKHFFLEPQMEGPLTYASGAYESPYGRIECGWRRENGGTVCKMRVPPNTTATLVLPEGEWREGEVPAPEGSGVGSAEVYSGKSSFTLLSGQYTFSCEK